MPLYVQAGLWGLLSGSALLLGVAIAYFTSLGARVVAAIMAFGSGVLISALSFDLMDEAVRGGGFGAAALGFVAGGSVYTAANVYLSRRGAGRRKRASGQEAGGEGAALAIAVGALLDGVPESIAIGVSLLNGAGVSMATVVAVFLSNLPEGLSSAAGMLKAGRSPLRVFGIWGGIAVASGIAALAGNIGLADAGPAVIALTNAIAAGAILAMLADTMIPEAFEEAHEYAGLITVAGFLVAFALSKAGG